MSAPRRPIASTALTGTLFVVFLGALWMLTGGASAHATEIERVDVVLAFDDLQPGISQRVHYPIDVPVDAQIAEAGFIRLTGIAEYIDWTIQLCGGQTCREVTEASAGMAIAPGSYDLQVSALLTNDVSGSGEALGRVRLVASDTLASTGSTAVRIVSLFAACAVVLGSLTLLAVRRREPTP